MLLFHYLWQATSSKELRWDPHIELHNDWKTSASDILIPHAIHHRVELLKALSPALRRIHVRHTLIDHVLHFVEGLCLKKGEQKQTNLGHVAVFILIPAYEGAIQVWAETQQPATGTEIFRKDVINTIVQLRKNGKLLESQCIMIRCLIMRKRFVGCRHKMSLLWRWVHSMTCFKTILLFSPN